MFAPARISGPTDRIGERSGAPPTSLAASAGDQIGPKAEQSRSTSLQRAGFVGRPTGLEPVTPGEQDRLISYGGNTYVFGPSGDLRSKTISGQTTTYSYDAFGALAQVILPDGDRVDYVLDALGRRVGKRLNGVLQRGWLYDGIRPIAELDGSGTVVARFIYATRQHVPDLMWKSGVLYRLVTDERGSVRIVVNASTGAVSQRLDYDVWGNVSGDSAPGLQPFGYAGGLWDSDTKLTRFGARDYDADSGRWTDKDPILFAGESVNLYVYTRNNPVMFIDVSGLVPNPALQKAFDQAYEQWWQQRPAPYDRWGPLNNLLSLLGDTDAPVCINYARAAAAAMNSIVNSDSAAAFAVWEFQQPTNLFGKVEDSETPSWLNAHATVQVWQLNPDQSFELIREYDPWWRIW